MPRVSRSWARSCACPATSADRSTIDSRRCSIRDRRRRKASATSGRPSSSASTGYAVPQPARDQSRCPATGRPRSRPTLRWSTRRLGRRSAWSTPTFASPPSTRCSSSRTRRPGRSAAGRCGRHRRHLRRRRWMGSRSSRAARSRPARRRSGVRSGCGRSSTSCSSVSRWSSSTRRRSRRSPTRPCSASIADGTLLVGAAGKTRRQAVVRATRDPRVVSALACSAPRSTGRRPAMARRPSFWYFGYYTTAPGE